MNPATPTPEETWWEVTTTTGLTLTLPAPSSDGKPVNAYLTLRHREPVTIQHRGYTYHLDPSSVLLIREFTKTDQSERIARALMKGASSTTSSTSGPGPESPSGDRESRRGRSTGGITKPRTH